MSNVDRNTTPLKSEDKKSNFTDQSVDENLSERRVLRVGYLSIQNFIRDKKDEISAVSSKKFLSIIDEVDGMHHLGYVCYGVMEWRKEWNVRGNGMDERMQWIITISCLVWLPCE
ncbi:putative Nse4/EID family protein [Helianthus annuus]|nr:putative Nse4/EID family protein [Helianthus annuus]